MIEPRASGLSFPCRFPIKAMGQADSGFEALVLALVGRHAPDLDASSLRVRMSTGRKWVSVTLTIEAQSQAQLDAIYRDLSGHERVRWVL